MDQLIKSIITNKFGNIISIISNKKVSREEIIKIYNYFMYFYTRKMIIDDTMYFLTYILFQHQKVLKVKKLDTYSEIIAWHIFRQQTKNKTYNLIKIYMDTETIKRRINSSIDLLKNNSKNINKLLGNHKKTSHIKNIIVETMIEYPMRFNDRIIKNNIMMANTNEKILWIHEKEIENRLLLIVKYYGINLLQILGINVINSSYFSMLSFEEKVSYYKDCLSTISTTGKIIYDSIEMKNKLKKRQHMVKHAYKDYMKSISVKEK